MGLEPSRRRLLAYGSLLTIGVAGCLDGRSDTEHDHSEGDHNHSEGDHDGDDRDDEHSHDHSSDHELGSPASEIEVEMKTDEDGSHFVPHVVHVEPGGTVEWVVASDAHDTTAYHPETHGSQQRIPDDATPWESELLSEDGETFERTFDREGVYDYVCTPHEGDGMVGTVVVGWPDPDDQPGLQPPSDDLPETAAEQLERYGEQVRTALEEGDGDDHSHDGDGHDDHDH